MFVNTIMVDKFWANKIKNLRGGQLPRVAFPPWDVNYLTPLLG